MKKDMKEITFLGKDAEFEGKLTFHGTFLIDGHFKGEISSDGNLIVGEDGMVEADMHVSYIDIKGEIHGNIFADQRVDIRAPGKVFGNIQAPNVMIDEGVIFEGTTRMYQAKEADARNKTTVKGPDEYTGGPPSTITAIYGIVTEQISGRPIKNATIKCRGVAKKNTRTNASGYYELINLEDGMRKLSIKAKGYRGDKAKIEISGGGTYEQNFELKRTKKELP